MCSPCPDGMWSNGITPCYKTGIGGSQVGAIVGGVVGGVAALALIGLLMVLILRTKKKKARERAASDVDMLPYDMLRASPSSYSITSPAPHLTSPQAAELSPPSVFSPGSGTMTATAFPPVPEFDLGTILATGEEWTVSPLSADFGLGGNQLEIGVVVHQELKIINTSKKKIRYRIHPPTSNKYTVESSPKRGRVKPVS